MSSAAASSTEAPTASSTNGTANNNANGTTNGTSATSSTPTVRPSSTYHVSKRAPKACANCHRRKVRCDAHMHPEGHPCSYCNSTGHECVLLPGRRGSTYQKTKKRLGAAAGVQAAPPKTPRQPKAQPQAALPTPTISEPHNADSVLFSLNDDHGFAGGYANTTSVLSPRYEPVDSRNSPESGANDVTQNPSMSDEHVWVQFLDKVHDHSRTGLLQDQLTAHLTPNYNSRLDEYAQTRENSADPTGDTKRRVLIYNGESMLDGAVPSMSGLHRFQGGATGSIDSSFSFMDIQSWGPPEGWSTIANPRHIHDLNIIPEDDKKYLLNHKKVNVFPPTGVCDRLIKSFFKHVYPNLPILDRPSFLRNYKRMMYSNSVYSLLLIHSVFYAATYHASSSLIQACGFPNRLAARAYFFSRAKILHGLDAEKEHLFIIQSCLLMTLWWTRYEEEKETRFYLAAGVLLSQRMGMHRTIRGGWGLGASERRLWKRIHWTLFNRDHISASSLGKPSLIRSTDVDVGDLTEEDFLENWGDVDENGANEAKQFCPPQTIINIKYTMELVKLAKIYEHIHCVQYSTQRPPTHAELEDIAVELQNWRLQLPSELSTSRYDEFRTWTPENFWPILLQLVHDRAISLHYRPRCSPPKKKTWGAGESSTDESTTLKDREKSRKAVVASANSTFRLVEDLLRHDLLRYCPPIIQTPLFIAMIVYAEEIKLSPESSPRFNLATNKINLGMMALGELRKVWAAASWSFRMFEHIIDRKFAPISTPDITGGETGPSIMIPSNNFASFDTSVNGNGTHGVHGMPIDPLLTAGTGGQPLTPPTAPLASGHCFWNADVDMGAPGNGASGAPTPFNAGTPMAGADPGQNPEFEFDLAWMAMSGLAGDIPFHSGSGGKGGVGGGDLLSMLGLGATGENSTQEMTKHEDTT